MKATTCNVHVARPRITHRPATIKVSTVEESWIQPANESDQIKKYNNNI